MGINRFVGTVKKIKIFHSEIKMKLRIELLAVAVSLTHLSLNLLLVLRNENKLLFANYQQLLFVDLFWNLLALIPS